MYFYISFIYSFMHLLDQHLLGASSVPGTALALGLCNGGKAPKIPTLMAETDPLQEYK